MKNLTNFPEGGTSLKAKNDNTLGRMRGGIRSRIGSMSLKNTSLFGVILTLLLTIGVGQMWGASGTIYVTPANMWGGSWDYSTSKLKIGYNYNSNNGDQWTGEQDMTLTEYTFHNYPVYSYTVSSSTNWAKIYVYHYKGNTKQATYNVGGDNWIDFSSYIDKVYNGWHNSAHEKLALSDMDANTEVTMYFAYNNSNDYTIKANMRISNDYDVWRTYTMTSTGHTISGKTIYTCTFNDFREHLYKLQFQRYDGSTFKNEDTPINNNWTAMSTYGGKMYNGSSWVSYQYDVTLDMQSGSGGTSSITATCGSAMPGSKTAPTRTGYTFGGYYTEENGSGTKYYNANMTSAATWPSDGSGPNTLYAKWTANQTTVTLNGNAPAGQTVTGGGTKVTATYAAALPSFSALTCDGGYALKGYYDATSDGNLIITSAGVFNANSGIWNRTDGSTLTLYAQWSLDRTLTYDGNTSTGGSVPAAATTYANGTEVTVLGNTNSLVKTGYTFTGWNTAANGSGTPYAAGDEITMDANYTLYAQWSENKSTVSLVASPTGAGTFTSGSAVTSVLAGVATKPAVTAVPVPGYKFSNWAVSGGATISSTSTNPTTVTGKGAGADATLTATFDRTYAFIEGRFHIMNEARTSSTNTFGSGDWDENSTRIPFGYDATNHQFVLSTHVTPKELTDNLGSCGDCKQYFFIKTSTASGSLTNPATYRPYTSGDSYQVFTTAGDSYKKQTLTPGNSEHSYRFNSSDESGYVKLYFNLSHIWYWLEQTLEYDANGGTGDAPAARTYYDRDQSIQAGVNAYTRDGYTFSGWNTQDDGLGTAVSENSWFTITSNTTLYAQWTPVGYTITLDKQTGATGYGSAGTAANPTATYNAVLPAISGSMPAGTGSYGFMGFYTGTLGTGLRLTDASGAWIASVEGYTDADKKWIHAGDVTLYAYYKQAEISDLTPDPAIIAPGETVTVTPTLSPAPAGTHIICWELQYSNGTALPSQPTFTPGVGNAVSFPAPSASATYRIQATLRSGSSCGGGSVLSTRSETFQVAGEHTVTIQYQDADGRTIKASTEITARPLAWTTAGDITPPTITGYTFARWDAGDGVSIKNGDSDPVTTTTTSSIQIKATYDGTLTAVYAKKRMIYFYNTLGWGSVYVYFYKNDSYWQQDSPYKGSGANTTYTWTNTPYSEGLHGQMQPVSEGSSIYYFDAEAAGVNASYVDVAFTEANQHGEGYFKDTKAVRRGDYKSSIPMFVPLSDQTPDIHNGTAYTNNGYWMNYPENTGYTLKIYDAWNATKETAAVRSFAFPYSGDLKMPLKLDVEFNEANHDYWFMIYRNDGTYLGSEYHFKQGYQDEQTITDGNNKNKITTSAPGNYTLTLTYHDNGSGAVNYYIDVDFPIASGDYRIYYSDNATWSKGAHTKDDWKHPSHSIAKATTEAKKDTVSFFIPKGVGISHTMKFQKASVTNEGVVSWSDVAGGGITIPSSITESGVYNFIVSQPAEGASISLEKVEPYTGNFYIRTDCAGNTKWDSFKNADHQMTYSDYAAENSGYTHYYAHWVESGNNVKFTIANDYSMCISDTLFEDYGTTIANISNTGALNSGNASIRFMWNQSTNKISRAYISGSSNISDRFLVLEGDAKMYDEAGHALTDEGGGKISGLEDNEINLVDDQNFVYERTIQVKTTARAKLTAKYNNNVQYFIGSSSETVELLGGTASDTKYSMRIVYDFKTNRLVKAYIPSGSAITEALAINADIMLVREHQEAGQQLTFDGGSLSKVQTVYGVMRFNCWTLNNKETTGGHSVVGDPKSAYERSLYWISFPFDVNLSDVFGFGTYGTEWIIMEYDGAERAAKGYWADSEGFWKYITNRRGVVLEAGKGYVLALDLDRMKDNNTSFWANNIEQVELFFPSAEEVKNIAATDTEITVDSHACTITPRPGQTDDRTKKDSHWNIIGVPSYANYGSTLKDGSGNTVTWNDNPETKGLPFLYEWNTVDNTYSVQSGTTYPFKAMHAYMVQYSGKLKWTLASATPVSAPARVPSAAQNIEFRMELQQNSQAVDQTFLRMTNDEEISANFDFNYDLSKQMNSGKANIYTMVEGYIQTAGNCLPISEQTTVVPVGVKIVTNNDYTFSIPEGTDGVGVTLIDTETGIRTVLSAVDYTVSLEAGTYDNRFVLEISPIRNMPTELETSDNDAAIDGVRKLLIDGLLYIVRDGKVYDARGARVE